MNDNETFDPTPLDAPDTEVPDLPPPDADLPPPIDADAPTWAADAGADEMVAAAPPLPEGVETTEGSITDITGPNHPGAATPAVELPADEAPMPPVTGDTTTAPPGPEGGLDPNATITAPPVPEGAGGDGNPVGQPITETPTTDTPGGEAPMPPVTGDTTTAPPGPEGGLDPNATITAPPVPEGAGGEGGVVPPGQPGGDETTTGETPLGETPLPPEGEPEPRPTIEPYVMSTEQAVTMVQELVGPTSPEVAAEIATAVEGLAYPNGDIDVAELAELIRERGEEWGIVDTRQPPSTGAIDTALDKGSSVMIFTAESNSVEIGSITVPPDAADARSASTYLLRTANDDEITVEKSAMDALFEALRDKDSQIAEARGDGGGDGGPSATTLLAIGGAVLVPVAAGGAFLANRARKARG